MPSPQVLVLIRWDSRSYNARSFFQITRKSLFAGILDPIEPTCSV
jgi:hypothetical protein